MSDPFSIAAGVIAVMQISQSLGVYVYGLTERPELCRQVATELACIHGLMSQLQTLEQYLQAQSKWQSKAAQLQALLESLQASLDKLDVRLRKVSVPQADALATWSVHEKSIKDLLRTIERGKSSILVQLSLIQADLCQIISEKVHGIHNQLEKLNSNVSESLQKIDSLTMDERAHHQQEYLRLNRKEREATLSWLSNISFVSEHNARRDKWVPGTTAWFFQQPAFLEWKECRTSEVLLILGNAGCGKSLIASRLVEHIKNVSPGDSLPMAYIYCSSKQPELRDSRALVSSLLQQLCQVSSVLNENAVHLREQYRRLPNAEPSLYEVAKVLRSVIKSFTSACFLIIDGLDECDDGARLAEVVDRLLKSQTALVRIAIFSRYACPVWPDYFEAASKIQIDAKANRNDIELFAQTQLQRFAKDKKVLRDENLRADIVKTLLEGADGMFLWVHLQAENLRLHTTPKSLRKALKQLPRGMEQVFQRSLERIRNQEEDSMRYAVRTLNWTLNARRPLQIHEMLEAIAVDADMSSIQADDLVAETELMAYCADLVILDPKEGYVLLLHSSLKAVLQESIQEHKSEVNVVLPLTHCADRDLAQVCVSYLLLDNFTDAWRSSYETIQDLVKQHPFLRYAAHHFAWHTARSTGEKDALNDQILMLLSNHQRTNLILDIVMATTDDLTYSKGDWPHDRNALHFMASDGLVDLCDKLGPDEMQRLSCETDSYGYTPLDLALWDQQHAMCLKLLNFESWLSKPTPHIHRLHIAIQNGWLDVVEKMLSLRARLDTRDERGLTPFHNACVHGHNTELLDVLLNAGSELDEVSADGNTCLTLAAELGRIEIVDYLLSKGANVLLQTDYGQTALHMASSNGHIQIVHRLLNHGHKDTLIHIADKYCETPLSDAVQNGHTEVVKLLLDHNADRAQPNIAGVTPLHVAAAYRQLECLLLLFQERTDLDLKDLSGCTPSNVFEIMYDTAPQALCQSLASDRAADLLLAQHSATREWRTPVLSRPGTADSATYVPRFSNSISNYQPGTYHFHTTAAIGSLAELTELLAQNRNRIWQRDAWGRTAYDLAIGEHRKPIRSAITRCQPRPDDCVNTYPELVNLSNQSYLQKPGVNFCLFLICEVCNQHIDQCHWLHCKLCSKLGEGWDICEHCFRNRREDESLCSSHHSREDLQLLFIANHMISGPMVSIDEL